MCSFCKKERLFYPHQYAFLQDYFGQHLQCNLILVDILRLQGAQDFAPNLLSFHFRTVRVFVNV